MSDNRIRSATNQSLDPEDWDEFRSLGHRMIDDLVDSLRTVRNRPVWQPVPEAVRESFRTQLPLEASGAEAVYEEFLRNVAPFPRGNTHPRFWGWVNGSGLPIGMLADLLAAAMNPSVGAFENAATMVEEQVLRWLKDMLRFPGGTGAVLTSGCSMSNIIGLAVARNAKARVDVRRLGVAAAPNRMVLYGSVETHSSVQKAVELLGLGSGALRRVPCDSDFRIDISELKATIREDRRAGSFPFCVVANAGTVNTGAVDDLATLADLCEAEDMWLHIDGAFGALAWLCPEQRQTFAGLQRADSLAFDLHKWMYLPYDVGCVFVRDADLHRSAFAIASNYMSGTARGPASYQASFADCGIELTRRFRALKVWMSLKAHGASTFERQIRENIAQAAYLAELISASPELELSIQPSLNIVCFRYVVLGYTPVLLDRFNQELLLRIQMSGVAVPSHTIIHGALVLRVAITNHRSRREDFDLFVHEIIRLGATLAADRSFEPGASEESTAT